MTISRPVLLLSTAALACLSTAPLLRAVAEAFLAHGPDGASITADHLRRAFVEGGTHLGWTQLGNSVLVAGLAAVFALVIGVPYALLVARTDTPCRTLLGAVYAAPLVLPPLLVAIAWTMLSGGEKRSMAVPEHWTQGAVAVLRAAALFALGLFPLVVLFTTRALRAVPAGVEEAARLVAGPRRVLSGVTLPLVRPAAGAAALFVFLFALHDFAVIDYLNWVRPLPQQLSVYPFKSFTAWQQPGASAGPAIALGFPLAAAGVLLVLAVLRAARDTAVATVSGDARPPQPWRLGVWRYPAMVAGFGVLAAAVVLPVAGLAVETKGLGSFRRALQYVMGPLSGSQELPTTLWLATGAAALAIVPAFVLAHHAARTGRLRLAFLAFLPLALPPVFLGFGCLHAFGAPFLDVPLPGGGTRNPFLDPDGPRFGPMLLLWAKYLPFAFAALWASISSVDRKLEEAAATAGAGRLARILGVTVPLSMPGIALAAALVFVFSVREIDSIVMLSTDTMMRRIWSLVHQKSDEIVASLALILLLIEAIPFVLLALLLPRRARAS